MTEHEKIELLNHINSTAKMIDYFKKEIDESIILLESNEEILNALKTQIKLHELINNLHKVIHIYVDVAAAEGLEIIWAGLKAVQIIEKEDTEDE